MKDLHAVDERGQNVFHALAAAQAHERRFADVMADLIRISAFHIDPYHQTVEAIEAANVTIFPSKDLGSAPLIQAIMKAKSHADALKEVESLVTKHTAATVISYLHGKISSQPVWDSPYYHDPPSIYRQTFLELLFTRKSIPGSNYRPLEGVKIHRPYLMKDFQGLAPIDIAERSGNLPAFARLYEYAEGKASSYWLLPPVAGAAAGFAAVSLTGADSTTWQLAYTVGGAVALSGLTAMCHRAFSKLPTALNKTIKASKPASRVTESQTAVPLPKP